MASGKKYGHMGLALLIAAPVIIFNPDMAVVDILPDFIAYIMISARKLRRHCRASNGRLWCPGQSSF